MQGLKHSPVPVAGGHTFTALSAGIIHTCGIDSTGKAWCWGSDYYGQVGDGSAGQADKYAPVAVADNHTFTHLSAGGVFTCGIDTTGKAWCWGHDSYGELGDGDDNEQPEYAPVAVDTTLTFTDLTAGTNHICGIDSTDKAWCWGYDGSEALGNGTGTDDKYSPVAVTGALEFTHLTAGGHHTCGIDTTGKAWCWGADWSGQVGNGNVAQQSTEPVPVAVASDRIFSHLTAGFFHTCGIDTTGTSWCWGAGRQWTTRRRR